MTVYQQVVNKNRCMRNRCGTLCRLRKGFSRYGAGLGRWTSKPYCQLAENATGRDYQNFINAPIIQEMVVKVNGQTAALDRELRDGDSIEVMTD